MENRAHALIAGIFVILLSISVALVAMWFSGNSTKRTDYLVVTKESVSGLNPQSAVHYRGVNIGKVEKIQFDPDNPHQILIHIAVNENVILRKSVYAQLGYQGVTGLAYIQLNDDGVNNEILSDERIPMRRSLLDEVTGSGQDLLTNVNKLVLKMHHLLNEQNQNHISQILQNIDKATKNFDGIAGHLQPVLSSFTELTIESGTLVKRLDQLLGELNLTVAKANEKEGIFDSLSHSTQELATTIPELRKLSYSLLRNSSNLDKVLHQLEENPQSLIFGRSPSSPGPGETGFVPPTENKP
ncbi:MlaD family protein [Nitrosomonas ureae]|uniref:Phospholipid/cholesterol/gamma-HCH transport system substrate-binding protein n=1 Tax=Nitrosomonas ureae TaxID=44577 RepID=A0A0S3AFP5_9PROT|nr:MlaD family protein [Nitrosomonas ureae]ALQ49835.1 mammalian cell entry protein [Nitrosomonas ureae]PTQ86637.1 phospholipid/cholesterol/gamma-HCH transport system substrate-binding protein [Nitrosomonas ureae]PXX16711.1 phospholipid/cholesterol/gamma-HCH transport system substrate-binding protein [Nitrosomonas ureae]SDT84676.1 phospholipid/cholesterol/gamma-HCH transport system substrate-binding protein [Nitrosomonas ureae]SEQ17073.1 phospholipid/cholesterol/gamma-HCH transport system subst